MAFRVAVEDFRGIRDFVREACGIALGDDKAYLVEARVSPLLPQFGFASFGELHRSLRSPGAAQLRQAVVEAVVTGETSWFRDDHPFRALRELVLPRLHREGRRMRLWSAGCSSGQEPYSIAMTALEFFDGLGGAEACRRLIEVVATDVSEAMLDAARGGLYDRVQVSRGLSDGRLERHFRREGGLWRVGDEVRSLVHFERANLVRPLPPLGTFDAVFLRNVNIYFAEATKAAVVEAVARCLAPGGCLFLGATESLPPEGTPFVPARHGGATLYLRRE